MKYIVYILILLILFTSCSSERYIQRLDKLDDKKGFVYKGDSIPGVRYKKSINPKSIAFVTVLLFVGGATGTIIYEEVLSPDKP